MNRNEHDETPDAAEAMARLEAADPARDATPDTSRLEASLVAAGTPAVRLDDPADELAAARARRRPARWLQVAAAVAGVAVIGGGGYVLGGAGGGDGAAAAMSLSAGDGGAGGDAAAPESSALGEMAATSGRTADMSFIYYGRTVFASSGLSEESGSRDAWAYDAASVYSAETAEAAAKALGVQGDAHETYGWVVGPDDGSAPSVTLSADGLASISYYDPTRDPWKCADLSGDTSLEAPAEDGTAKGDLDVQLTEPSAGAPESCPPEPTVSSDEAIAEAKATMEALGVDPSGYEFESDASSGLPGSVAAYQVVDDQRTNVTWSFTVMDDGVQSLWGSLAPLVELGSYDVVSAAEAAARLNDPRFGATSQGGVHPLAYAAEAADADLISAEEPAPTPTVPATPSAGSDLSWPVQDVTLTDARLGLALLTLEDGAAVLAPTYELSDADGNAWTVIAVVDDQLAF